MDNLKRPNTLQRLFGVQIPYDRRGVILAPLALTGPCACQSLQFGAEAREGTGCYAFLIAEPLELHIGVSHRRAGDPVVACGALPDELQNLLGDLSGAIAARAMRAGERKIACRGALSGIARK